MKYLIILILFIPSICTSQVIVGLSSTTAYNSGDTLTITMSASGLSSSHCLNGIQGTLNYDPNILEFINHSTPYQGMTGAGGATIAPGVRTFVWSDLICLNNGNIWDFTFRYIGTDECDSILFVNSPTFLTLSDGNTWAYIPGVVWNGGEICGCKSVTIDMQPQANQTICHNSSTSLSVVTIGNSPILYQWQYYDGTTWINVNNGTPAGAIYSGNNSATLQINGITAGGSYDYRCIVTNCDGNSVVESDQSTITVQSAVAAGAIGSNQIICNGTTPLSLTSNTAGTGSGTITYRWESSVSPFTTWTTIAGATGATYAPGPLTQTTHFRRITISTQNNIACESIPTTPVVITVQNIVASGAIGSNQTICNGATPVALTSNTAGTGIGTITYRWESSVSPFTTWTTIAGATGATYAPGPLTQTTHFRRITISTQNNIACESIPTTPVVITVQNIVTAGAIGSNQTICNGATPVALTSNTAGTGSGTITYRWESSVSPFTTWTTIAGATGATYAPGPLTQTTHFRRITISTQNNIACESIPTTPVVVTVQNNVTAGAIGSNQTICNGATPVALTSNTAGTGSGTITYRWESSVSPFTTWTTIAGATGATYAPGPLTQTTHFRRITISTQNGVNCESIPTTPTVITLQNTVTSGDIGSNQTICNGATPAGLTSNTAGTGSGTITYRWESSVSPFTTWTTIAGATGATYTPGALTQTTHFRRITISTQNGIACESVPTPHVVISVLNIVTAGEIGSNQIICYGITPALLTNTLAGTGSGTIAYQWESSVSPFTTWTTIAGATGATYDPVLLVETTRFRRITLSTQNGTSCESNPTAHVEITVNPLPTVTCPTNNSFCIELPPFPISGGTPSGGTFTGAGVVGNNFDPNAAGIGTHVITYTYIDANGCSNQCDFSHEVTSQIQVSFPGNLHICFNESPIILSGGTPLGGVYSGPGVSGGIFNPTVAGVGTHTLTYEISGYCGNYDTSLIFVHDLPNIEFDVINEFCIDANDGQILLTVEGGKPPYSIVWSNGNDSTHITGLEPGLYSVIVSDMNLCMVDGEVDVLKSDEVCPDDNLFIPNIFSPNGDGQNDKLYVRGRNISSLHLIIYNRWGRRVFETSEIEIGWDGKHKGKFVEPGVYGYVLKAVVNNRHIKRGGSITVVH
jgi:gliding motility-associated-like protein